MPEKKKFVRVREHVRSMPQRERQEGSPGYPKDIGKCTMFNCANHKYNSQDQLICTAYFDFIPKPWRCEEDGKFSPRVR